MTPRRETLVAWLVALAVYVVSLGVLVIVSRQTGPATDELPTLAAIEQRAELVKRIAKSGLSELRQPEHRAALDSGVLVLTAAWSKLSLGRAGVLDPLTAMRLPWLLLGAFVPLSVYAMLRPTRGRAVALGGALLCLGMPRFGHAVVVHSEGALVAAAMCLVLVAHVRAMGSRTTVCWAVLGALALGFGAALSLAVLWVLPLVVLHFAWARRESLRRSYRDGRFPLPTLVLYALPLAPLALLALRPELWKASPANIARFLLAPLGGAVAPRGPAPAGFAWSFLVHTLPLAVALMALFGVGVAVHAHLARRFASGSLRPRRDRHALGALAALGICCGAVGPALSPRVLTTFPPRVEIMLPFVALAAAIGLGALSSLAGSVRAGRVVAAVSLGALTLVVLTRASTASASRGPLGGGSRTLPLGDGSELAALGRPIDALGRPSVTLSAPPGVPPELWRWLGEARRMRTTVSVQPNGELTLVRGAAPGGTPLAQVRRDGLVLWTLSRSP